MASKTVTRSSGINKKVWSNQKKRPPTLSLCTATPSPQKKWENTGLPPLFSVPWKSGRETFFIWPSLVVGPISELSDAWFHLSYKSTGRVVWSGVYSLARAKEIEESWFGWTLITNIPQFLLVSFIKDDCCFARLILCSCRFEDCKGKNNVFLSKSRAIFNDK